MAMNNKLKFAVLPDHRSLVQVGSYESMYSGGPHGHSRSRYHLFDMDLQSQVSLKDLLLPDHSIDQKLQLDEMLEEAYNRYLADEQRMSKESIIRHKQYHPLYLSDSVYFTDQGLVFSYQPYEIGPYAMGVLSCYFLLTSYKGLSAFSIYQKLKISITASLPF